MTQKTSQLRVLSILNFFLIGVLFSAEKTPLLELNLRSENLHNNNFHQLSNFSLSVYVQRSNESSDYLRSIREVNSLGPNSKNVALALFTSQNPGDGINIPEDIYDLCFQKNKILDKIESALSDRPADPLLSIKDSSYTTLLKLLLVTQIKIKILDNRSQTLKDSEWNLNPHAQLGEFPYPFVDWTKTISRNVIQVEAVVNHLGKCEIANKTNLQKVFSFSEDLEERAKFFSKTQHKTGMISTLALGLFTRSFFQEGILNDEERVSLLENFEIDNEIIIQDLFTIGKRASQKDPFISRISKTLNLF